MKTIEGHLKNANQNRDIIDGLYKAFAAGDIPTVLGILDPNIVWNELEGNPYQRPDAVLNGILGRIGGEHDYFNLKNILLLEMLNDKVLATLRYDAKYKNGESYVAQVAHFWTLKEGKVVAFQQYVDTKKLRDARI